MALLAAIPARRLGEKIYVLLDNQSGVGALQSGKISSYIRLTRKFLASAGKAEAIVRWMPGHSGIGGDEEADREARAALQMLPAPCDQLRYTTLAYLRRLMQRRRQELIDEWWSTACPARYRDLDLQVRRRKPPELALPHRLLHNLLAARSGHGDFAAYHRRSQHDNTNLLFVCGQEKSPTHFIRCRRHAFQMRKLRDGMTINTFISKLLGPHCLEKFKEFADYRLLQKLTC